MDTGQNLNEGGFPCAVFTAQGMHLALPDVKGHAVQRPHAGEHLDDVLTLDDGFYFRQFGYLQSVAFDKCAKRPFKSTDIIV